MGLPCVVSKIRGNVDLVDDCKGGYLIDPLDYIGFKKAIIKILETPNLAISFEQYNRLKIKDFDIEIIKRMMVDIFKEIL